MSWPEARPRPARVAPRVPLAAVGGAIIAGAMTSAVMFGSGAPQQFVTRDEFGGRPVIAGTPRPTVPPPTTTLTTTTSPVTTTTVVPGPTSTRAAEQPVERTAKPTTTPRARPTGGPTKTTPSCRPAPHCG